MKHPVLVRLHNQFCNQRTASVTQWRGGREGRARQGMHLFQKQSGDLASKFERILEV